MRVEGVSEKSGNEVRRKRRNEEGGREGVGRGRGEGEREEGGARKIRKGVERGGT